MTITRFDGPDAGDTSRGRNGFSDPAGGVPVSPEERPNPHVAPIARADDHEVWVSVPTESGAPLDDPRVRDFAAALLDAWTPGSGETAGQVAANLLVHPLVLPYLAAPDALREALARLASWDEMAGNGDPQAFPEVYRAEVRARINTAKAALAASQPVPAPEPKSSARGSLAESSLTVADHARYLTERAVPDPEPSARLREALEAWERNGAPNRKSLAAFGIRPTLAATPQDPEA